MLLFFDTETTGLPRNWKAPLHDLANWPRMVQLAWLLYDESGQQQEADSRIVRPERYQIPARAASIHGIDQARAMAEGQPLEEVLGAFDVALQQAHTLVAHNLVFDQHILGAEYLRAQGHNPLAAKQGLCTKEAGTSVCRLPGAYGRGYKWPSLNELHQTLFAEDIVGAHDAAVDIAATARCFWALRARHAI